MELSLAEFQHHSHHASDRYREKRRKVLSHDQSYHNMSSTYNLEPTPTAKVILHTTFLSSFRKSLQVLHCLLVYSQQVLHGLLVYGHHQSFWFGRHSLAAHALHKGKKHVRRFGETLYPGSISTKNYILMLLSQIAFTSNC